MTLRSWLASRLRRFWFGQGVGPRRLAEIRFAVVDVDVTGTHVRRDAVKGIAALPIVEGAFRIAELRYCAVTDALALGAPLTSDWHSTYMALRDAIADSTIVTYNPAFVRHMISRACRAADLPALQGEWIDLELTADVIGRQDNELTTMKYWLEKMKVTGWRPHDATNDVFAMAQLLQAVLAYSEDAGVETLESLTRMQSARPWLRRR